MRKSAYDKYCQTQSELSDKFLRYIEGGWCRRDDDAKERLYFDFKTSNSIYMAANNISSRMDFAAAALRHIADYFIIGEGQESSSYLVTLIPKQYAVTLGSGADWDFNLQTIQSWARHHLRGIDFIGTVEPALFTNWRKGQRTLSMHVHCIAWNIDDKVAGEIEARINACTESLVPRIPAADIRPITKGTEETSVLYLMKAPTAEYRIYPKKKMRPHAFLGQKTVETGYWGVKKDVMRPGLYLQVRDAMQGWYLDRMLIAGGAGKSIMARLRKDVLSGLTDEERRGRGDERPI